MPKAELSVLAGEIREKYGGQYVQDALKDAVSANVMLNIEADKLAKKAIAEQKAVRLVGC